MDNLQDIFSSVLSNPDAVSKLRSLGKELGLTQDSSDNTSNQNNQSTVQNSTPFDISALSGLLSSSGNPQSHSQQTSGLNSLSPDTMQSIARLMPLFAGLNQEDETTVLLNSLRPFLSGDKRRRLDEAGKILRVMRILPKLRSTGLF